MVKKICNIFIDILLVFLFFIIIFNIFSIFYSKLNGQKKQENWSLFGYKFFIDASNSMSPTIKKGDLVVAKEIDISSLKVGDIIVFDDLEQNITITHRIIGIKENDASKIEIQSKGDNNDSKDQTLVTKENLEAKYLFKISYLGTLLLFFHTFPGFLVLSLTFVTILIVVYLLSLCQKNKE